MSEAEIRSIAEAVADILLKLASALNTTPNELLGVGEGGEK